MNVNVSGGITYMIKNGNQKRIKPPTTTANVLAVFCSFIKRIRSRRWTSLDGFVVDDCCLSRSGDDGLTTVGTGGGSAGGGITVGISIGIEGKNEGAGDILIRFVTYKNEWLKLIIEIE